MGKKLLAGALVLGALVLVASVSGVGLLRRSGQDVGHLVPPVLGAWAVVYAVAAGLAVREAVRLLRLRDLDRLQRATKLVKLIGIPFFVLNFVLLSTFVVATAFFGIGFVLAPVFVIATYLVLLPTSAYGLACLVLLQRDRAVSPTFFTVHVVLHGLFVADIVSTLLVAHRAKQVLTGR